MQQPKQPGNTNTTGYTLYPDGATPGNGKSTEGVPSGWGAYIRNNATGEESDHFGGIKLGTNNIAELTAVIEGLARIPAGSKVAVFTDSNYVVEGMNSWMAGWKRRGWVTSKGEEVKNQHLWKALDALRAKYSVTFAWVKGHAKDPGNIRADKLANKGVALVTGGVA